MGSSAQLVSFEDTSVDCAICLTPLTDHPNIQLTCGHKWHLHCVKEQLQHSHPNPARRLLFSGTRCAKCKSFCDHPELASLTRHTNELRRKADDILTELISSHKLAEHTSVTSPSGPYYNDVLLFARAHFALFLCSACGDPYFGGTVACTDDDDRDLPPDDRLCHKCTPRTAAICPHPVHTGFHIWKCRFCCQPATHVCYGSTHMCDDCHQADEAGPARPPPKQCPGADNCSSPFPSGLTHHQNGPGPNCEQLLCCAWCTSDPLADGIARDDRGSPNLLYNTSGEAGMRGWTTLTRASWNVEQSDFPFLHNRTNFVSTHSWCAMGQAVDLARFLNSPADVFIEVSARYMARTDCPSVFQVCGALLDQAYNVLETFDSEELSASADFWDRARHIFRPTASARYAVIIIRGKDTRFWAGNFGSKVANACVRVMYDTNTMDTDVLLPGETDRVTEEGVASGDLVQKFAQWREDDHIANVGIGDEAGIAFRWARNENIGGGPYWGERARLDEARGVAPYPRQLYRLRDGELRNAVQQNDGNDGNNGDATNLLDNGCGEDGLRPWIQLWSGSWASVLSESVSEGAHFRSSHRACVMTQAVDLRRVDGPSTVHVRASARFRASSARGGSVQVELVIFNGELEILKRVSGAEREAVIDRWEEEEVWSEAMDGATFAAMTIRGDGGNEGAYGDGVLVRECAVRVRREDEEEGRVSSDVVLRAPREDAKALTARIVTHMGVRGAIGGRVRRRDQLNCVVL